MTRLLRSALVIARRDYVATVFSRTFLLFLLGPLFPVVLGVMFGGVGARMAAETQRPVVAVVAERADFDRLATARQRIAAALDGDPLVRLMPVAPEQDIAAQARRLLASKEPPVLGVLTGGLAEPSFVGPARRDSAAVRQLRLLLHEAQAATEPAGAPLKLVVTPGRSAGSLSAARAVTARAGQAILFLLTILLAGMLLSQLIEEKSNKVIEILAAAVPMDSIFLGKLVAMLAVSLTGIAVWGTTAAVAIAAMSGNGLAVLPPPAIGWPLFCLFALLYFAMSYLLLGAAFLGIGAQASTVREVQTLSMPVTMAQVVIFALASAAVGTRGSSIATIAAVFPLSSPYVMFARAAESPALWPHLVALAWQLLWVGLILHLAAGLFRRSVLKSGGPRRRWFRRRQRAEANG